MATRTIYVDPYGVNQTGYIIDNKTYKDPDGKTRIDIGSVVTGGDGTMYKLTESGGVVLTPQAAQAEPTISERYTKDLYDAYNDLTKQALEAVYAQNVTALNSARAGVPETYQNARNTAAAQSAVQKANFNAYAAAAGLNSGTGGQAQLAFSNTLQDSLSTLDKEQSRAIANIDLQIANLTVQNKADIAKALAGGNLEAAKAMLERFNTQAAQLNALKQQQEADAREMALAAAKASGLYDIMAAYGWSPAQIASAHAQWQREHAQ